MYNMELKEKMLLKLNELSNIGECREIIIWEMKKILGKPENLFTDSVCEWIDENPGTAIEFVDYLIENYSTNIFSYDLEEFKKYIGKKVKKCHVRKKRNKPYRKKFKSGLYENTIKDVIIHPILNIPAYIFEEDDSYVECRRCK